MKNKKSLLVFSFAIALIIGSVFAYRNNLGSITSAQGLGGDIHLDIIDAYYGDFDSDNNEDDIIVLAILDPDVTGDILAFLTLEIILPTNYKFTFEFSEEIDSDGSRLLVTITTYNTATTAGWYTAKLNGLFVNNDMLYYTISQYTFDPPTENGAGEPGSIISITSYSG